MICQAILQKKKEHVLVAVIDMLTSLARIHKKSYSYPSQLTILRLLGTYHGITMSRRTLNTYLAYMRVHYLIKTFRGRSAGRNKKTGQWQTTAYYVLSKALKLLKTLENKVKRILSSHRVQLSAHNIFTTKRVFKKVPKEKGILLDNTPQNTQRWDEDIHTDLKLFIGSI
mgnify:FL=1